MNDCYQYDYFTLSTVSNKLGQIHQQKPAKQHSLIYFRSIIKKYYFLWQCLQFVIITYTIISASLVLCFFKYFQEIQNQLLSIHIIIYLLFLVDLVIKTIVAQKTNKWFQKKLDRQEGIVYIYLFKDLMILDLSNLVIQFAFFITPYAESRYFKLIILVRILDIVAFNNAIYLLINKRFTLKIFYTIVKLAYVYFLFVHYFGSIFYLIDQTAIDQQWYGPFIQNPYEYYQGNLLCYTPIQQFDNYGRYLYGIYFLSSMISTIAYGDIVGKNPEEQKFVMILLVFSTISIALILQQLISVINITMGQSQFIKSYNGLKSFMDSCDVPFKVQNRVRSYLLYVDYEKNLQDQDIVMKKLPLKLRKDIHYYSYGEIITRTFQTITNDPRDLFWLSNEIQQVTYHADMYVFQTFTRLEATPLSSTSFLSLQSGKTIFYTQYDQFSKSIVLGSRSHYNFYEWLTNSKTRFGVIATTLCKFLMIKPEKLQQFAIEMKKMKNIKQVAQKAKCRQISAQKLLQNCICEEQGHQIDECPKMHLIKANANLPKFQSQYEQNIIRIDTLLSQKKYQNPRSPKNRKNVKSTKLKYNKQQKKQNESIIEYEYLTLLVRIINGMKDHVAIKEIVINQQDSKYDEKGVDQNWSIQKRHIQIVDIILEKFF